MHPRRHLQQHRVAGARARPRASGRRGLLRLRPLLSFTVALLLIAVLGVGLAHHRLRQGPVSLGVVGEMIARRLDAGADGLKFEIGQAVFALGEPGAASGLLLRDVVLRRPDGGVAAAAPVLAVDFHLFDLIQGRLAPTRLLLLGAEAEIRRDAQGRFRLGDAESERTGGALGFLALLDEAEAGLGPLRRLEAISARRGRITLRDEITGRAWRLEQAEFAVLRDARGEVGRLAGLIRPAERAGDAAAAPGRFALSGVRPRSGGPVRLDLRFSNLPLARLAADIARLAGAEPPPPGTAPIRADGRVKASLDADGRPTTAQAELALASGRLPGLPAPFDRLDAGVAALEWSQEAEAVEIRRLAVSGPAGEVALSGWARPLGARTEGAGPAGLSLALRIDRLAASPAAGFAAPLVFEDGRLEADLLREPRRLELSSLLLQSPELTVEARGAAELDAAGPELALEVETGAFDAATLMAAWPLPVAEKARNWIVERVRAGRVTGATASVWLARGEEPEATADFEFVEGEAIVLPGLPPLQNASGHGRISVQRLDIALGAGRVTPPDGEAITLDGSSFHVPDLPADPSTGRPEVRAEGRIADVLSLLDQPPLRLTRKISADGFAPEGRAEIRASLAFPMLKGLEPEQVEVAAEAELTAVAASPPGLGLDLSAEALALSADTHGLRLSGSARIDGISARIVWTERFGPDEGLPRREMSAAAQLDQAALDRLGASGQLEAPSGAVDARLALEWAEPGAPAELRLDVDLTDAALRVPALGWSKPQGASGRVGLSGRRAAGGAVELDRLEVEAPRLAVQGAARFGADGGLRRLDLSRLRLDETADVALSLRRRSDGASEVEVTGARLDLGALARRRREAGAAAAPSGGAESPAPPLRARLALESVALVQGVTLADARGRLVREEGVTRAALAGAVNGGGAARLRYRQTPDGGAVITLRSDDAGRLLADLDIARTVVGGRLRARARLPADDEAVEGVAEIEDIRVVDRAALDAVVSQAAREGLVEPPPEDAGGYVFDRVEVPFELDGQTLRVEGALAAGLVLGLKVDGTYDLETRALDLSGVLTPAYAVNSLLNRVPLIGELLGGEGEGLIALTFTVGGTADDPRISANPLSVLTPGVFRRIFQLEAASQPAPPDLFESAPFGEPER